MLPRILMTKRLICLMVCILLCLTITPNGVAAENGIMKRDFPNKLQPSVQSDVYIQSDDYEP